MKAISDVLKISILKWCWYMEHKDDDDLVKVYCFENTKEIQRKAKNKLDGSNEK